MFVELHTQIAFENIQIRLRIQFGGKGDSDSRRGVGKVMGSRGLSAIPGLFLDDPGLGVKGELIFDDGPTSRKLLNNIASTSIQLLANFKICWAMIRTSFSTYS